MLAAGIAPDRIILDPGLGFAKHGEHNWAAAARPRRRCRRWASRCWWVRAASPSSVGSSQISTGPPVPVGEREHANTALTVHLAQQGVWGLRVHDVRAARDALPGARAADREEDRHD